MTLSAQFTVPPSGYGFYSEIVARSRDLIDRGIWSGIKQVRLLRWLKNFETDEEKYLAACIIDSLIYRSDDQTTALLVHLFQRSLVDLTRLDPPAGGPIETWLELLRSSQYPPSIRLVASVSRHDSPHKSAHLVSRLMKRQLGIEARWIAKPWEIDIHIKNGAKILVFIDDFLGTGQQFEDLVRRENLGRLFPHSYVVYAPFVAHASGIARLKKAFPSLRISAAETLEAQHCVFSPESRSFDDGINKPESARDFYFDFLLKKGIRLVGDDRLGYGGLGLSYVFEHAVPDNNLPILWWPSAGSWAPLFDR